MKRAYSDSSGVSCLIPLDKIVPSKTNPRRRSDPEYIAKLAASIKEVGVLQPIIVRAAAKVNTFEIVAGECRWMAAKVAGLPSIPSVIKDYDDQQALDAQIIENLHRKDVHPMEESDGYAALVKSGKYGKGDAAVSEIAKRVGQTPEYIGRRLKYQSLTKKAREAFAQDTLLVGHADVLCRLSASDQDELLKREILDRGGMTVASLRSHVARHVEQQLSAAPFDLKDAELVKKAGACVSCPKRTGATASLFGESPKDDRCLDKQCFQAKLGAHVDGLAKSLKAEGFEVVLLDLSAYYYDKTDRGLRTLGRDLFSTASKPTGTKGIVIDPGYSSSNKDARFGQVWDVHVKKQDERRTAPSKGDGAFKEQLRKAKIALSKDFRRALAKEIGKRMPKKFDLSAARLAVVMQYAGGWKAGQLCKHLGWKGAKNPSSEKDWVAVLTARAKKMTDAEALKALLYFPAESELDTGRTYGMETTNVPEAKRLAEALGVDFAAVRKDVGAKHPMPKKPGAEKPKPVKDKGARKPLKKSVAAKTATTRPKKKAKR